MWTKSLFLLLISFNLYALDCPQTNIRRQIEPKQYKEEQLQLCDQKNGVHFSSPDCADLIKCAPDKKGWKIKEFRSEVTSPGFAACQMMGGKPDFIEIWREEKWYITDLCFFAPKTFVDNDRLYDYFFKARLIP
jgi:hypothetical protein